MGELKCWAVPELCQAYLIDEIGYLPKGESSLPVG
jgi:hypothetical protein